MTELSLAAQAVLKAGGVDQGWPIHCKAIAAALEAAADQVVPEHKPWLRTSGRAAARHDVRLELLAIAAELRGNTDAP